MSAPQITVRALGVGWVVSTGDEADGWYVTTPDLLAKCVCTLAEEETSPWQRQSVDDGVKATLRKTDELVATQARAPAEPDSIVKALRDLRAGVDALVLSASRMASA